MSSPSKHGGSFHSYVNVYQRVYPSISHQYPIVIYYHPIFNHHQTQKKTIKLEPSNHMIKPIDGWNPPCPAPNRSPSNRLEGEPFLLHGRQDGPGVDAIVEIPPEGKKKRQGVDDGRFDARVFLVVLWCWLGEIFSANLKLFEAWVWLLKKRMGEDNLCHHYWSEPMGAVSCAIP